MKIVLVGRVDDQRVIRWQAVIRLALALSLVLGLGTGTIFYCISGYWAHWVILFGILQAIGIIWIGLFMGLRSPLNKLVEL